MPLPGSGPFSLSEMLAAELNQVDQLEELGWSPEVAGATQGLPSRDQNGAFLETNEAERRRRLYAVAFSRGFSALSLSGGGIRSASFCLGVIQALADHNLLCNFQYLSTVSGGGYIGSWLSAWLYHNRRHGRPADMILSQLKSRRGNPDREVPQIAHLRAYSAYLTPRVGLTSADLWAAVAIIFRNLLLNWLILVPAIALPVVVVKLLVAYAHSARSRAPDDVVLLIALAGILLAALSFGYKLARLYARRFPVNAQRAETRFLRWSLLPAVLAGLGAAWIANRRTPGATPADILAHLGNLPTSGWLGWLWMAVLAMVVYGAAIAGAAGIAALRNRPPLLRWKSLLSWAGGAVVFGTLIWCGARGYGSLPDSAVFGTVCVKTVTACVVDKQPHPFPVTLPREVVLVIFGVPWFLLAAVLAQTAYLLLSSYSPRGDVEREWLGRAGGWHLIAALGWVALSAIVLLGPIFYDQASTIITTLGGVSAILTAFLGKSSLTAAKGDAGGWKPLSSNIALAIAGPLFAIVLLIVLSVVYDRLALGPDQATYDVCLAAPEHTIAGCAAGYPLFGLAVLAAVMGAADWFVNVNRFSLHALYRNRLVRAFLGGARAPDRHPDGFTGFDWDDNLRLWQLWPEDAPAPVGDNWRPYHILNIALNLASDKRLAWQQRKASSFIATPQFCGTAQLGYRKSREYGDPGTELPPYPGMSLATAMAISGAAVSPNMGYHSSPSVAFLLTLFNVRLGWWLGNPGDAGSGRVGRPAGDAPFRQDAPPIAIWPLLAELFGTTTQEAPWVYLSDGGHFENLGLYEMVRRRCRWIVVCDGAQDKDRQFEDLGNAVRKIWIDLGARIRFPKAPLLAATKDTKPAELAYYALGTIEYTSDGDDPEHPPTGKILYIKPAVRGDEGAAEIIAYQRLHPEFPQQSTLDQWFDEPQLEAYRALGWFIVDKLIEAAGRPASTAEFLDRLERLPPVTLTAPAVLEPG